MFSSRNANRMMGYASKSREVLASTEITWPLLLWFIMMALDPNVVHAELMVLSSHWLSGLDLSQAFGRSDVGCGLDCFRK